MRKILFLFLALSSFYLPAQAREVNEIKITSTWGGLGTPQKSELLIIRKPKGYFAKGDKIEKSLIDNLLTAIDAPEIKQFETANLGITQEWLNANAEIGVKEYADYYFSTAAPNQKELYLSSFKNLQLIEEILPSVLRGGWTDDYPSFTVEITEPDGSKTTVGSDAQPSFMLPWEITRNGNKFKTYNADISRALVVLLPKKFTNRDRLSGDNIRRVLAESVMRKIKDDWKFLDVENKAGDTLKTLKQNYTIISGEINSSHGIDYGKMWVNGNSSETNLQLVLIKDSFPKGFAINLKLPFQSGKTENLEVVQNEIDKYQDLVFSVSWLKNIIETGKQSFQLRFIKNRSFSEKAMETFADDMKKIGKDEIIAEVEREQKKIALVGVGDGLEYYQSYWLVLPDKKVILWRNGYNSYLNWSEKDFKAQVCPNYSSGIVKCIGAVISPEGKIASK